MCGIAGFWDATGRHALESVARVMADALLHRGPDDAGTWVEPSMGLALAHRRLAILDLSPAGHQPMASAHGRFVMVFNGEIYNHLALRQALDAEAGAIPWRGHSDTETLLAGFECWGVEATLKQAVGMFAIALWDRQERVLVLARDRAGEKPLYYGWQGDTLLFGSELKALRRAPGFDAEVDRDALALYLRHNVVPAPHTIFRGVFKLMPGHWLCLPLSKGADACRAARPRAYWSLAQVVEDGRAQPFLGTDAEAVDALEQVLGQAVEGQMLADVPLGAFLSGGVDSSTIVALMQARSARPVKTFTIGFDAQGYNEAEHAKAVARHLGTEHTELYVTSRDALDVVPSLPAIWDEPFADSSQIPTLLVSRMARRHVTVSLSGDGGDELFGGYNRHFHAPNLWRKLERFPYWMRRAGSAALKAPGPDRWDRWLASVRPVLPAGLRVPMAGYKLDKLGDAMAARDAEALYKRLVSHWHDPAALVLGAKEASSLLDRPQDWPRTDGFAHWIMAMDTLTYLPDDILTKVDRASMAVSLESRVPLLDHRVMALAWRLPLHMKIRNGVGKWALREVLYRHVPRALIERPKQGFGIPLGDWLRGDLREWAEDLLEPQRLKDEGYFAPEPVARMWHEHHSGVRNWQFQLWDVLMFQAWLRASK